MEKAVATTQQPTFAATAMAAPMLGMSIPFNSMQEILEFSKLMATAKGAVPALYMNNPGACMAVTMQAIRWGMDPFSVAQKTHEIRGVLGYEGQLINAIVTSMAPTTGRLQYEWYGDWSKVIGNFIEKTSEKGKYTVPGWTMKDEEGCGIKVFATMKGETEPRVLDLLLTQAGVRNSTLWATDPKQQLAYLGVKRWARLYCPDVILGVYSPDEIEAQPIGEREVGPGAAAGTSDLDIKPKARAKKTAETIATTESAPAAAATENAADPAPAASAEAAPVEDNPEAGTTYAQIADVLNKANSPETLSGAVERMTNFLAVGDNEQFRGELAGLYKARLKVLKASA